MAQKNLEKLKLGNYWFSRAGRYDKQHGGTFGDDRHVNFLSSLGLPFRTQISAAYANIGHSNNRGGEHAAGALDIGFSDLSRQQQQQVINRVKQLGYGYLHEDPNGPNNHLHVRLNGQSASNVLPQVNFTKGQTQTLSPAYNFNVKTPGEVTPITDVLDQIDRGETAQFFKPETSQTISGGVKANTITPINVDVQQPQTQSTDVASEFDAIFQQGKKAQEQQALEQGLNQGIQSGLNEAKPLSLIDQGLGFLGGLANQAGQGIQTEVANRLTPQGALDAVQTAGNFIPGIGSLIPASDTTKALGGGAAQFGANVLNFGSGITGNGWDTFQIPTELQQATERYPVTGFVGENALPALIPTASLLGKGRVLGNLALDTAAQAGIGFVASRGDLGERGLNAALAGGLNLGAAGLGGLARNIFKKADVNVANLTPDQLTQTLDLPKDFNATGVVDNSILPYVGPLSSELPQPKQALESANVFSSQINDINTAKQLLNETASNRVKLESDLQARYGVDDPVLAQQALGKDILNIEANYRQFNESQYLPELRAKKSELNNLLNLRQQEISARQLLDELDPQGIYRNQNILPEVNPSSKLNQAPEHQVYTGLFSSDNTPITKRVDLPPTQTPIANVLPDVRPSNILTPDGVVKPSAVAPDSGILRPVTQNTDQLVNAPTGNQPEVFNKQFLGENPQAAIDALNSSDKTALSIQDAFAHVDAKQKAGLFTPEQAQLQKDILTQFVESGRRGTTFDMVHKELKEGLGTLSEQMGKTASKERTDLAPFAITNRTIKPATEVNNLVKQLGSPEAAYQNLVQRAEKYGITPASGGKTYKANAVKIAQQLYEHPKGKLELTHTYLENHNFKSGGEGTTRGYRLDTIERAGMGAKEAQIPENVVYKNQIKAQYDNLQSLANAPNLPDSLKKPVQKVLNKPGVTANDMKALRKALSNFEELKQFCNLFGLE